MFHSIWIIFLMLSFVFICTHSYCSFPARLHVHSSFMLNCSARNLTAVKTRGTQREREREKAQFGCQNTENNNDTSGGELSMWAYLAFMLSFSRQCWRGVFLWFLVNMSIAIDISFSFILLLLFLVTLTRSSFVYLLHVTVVFPVFFLRNYQQYDSRFPLKCNFFLSPFSCAPSICDN
jgi:hypothetical protein